MKNSSASRTFSTMQFLQLEEREASNVTLETGVVLDRAGCFMTVHSIFHILKQHTYLERGACKPDRRVTTTIHLHQQASFGRERDLAGRGFNCAVLVDLLRRVLEGRPLACEAVFLVTQALTNEEPELHAKIFSRKRLGDFGLAVVDAPLALLLAEPTNCVPLGL